VKQSKLNVNLHFDEMISAPCRLGILATLVPGEPISFTEMKAATSLSDGNLHVQTRKLAGVGYIDINKVMRGRRSVTEFRLTELGLERLRLHVMKLQKVLDAATGETGVGSRSRRRDDAAVWS
jgi:Winged helix DNA-binding domain